MTEVSFPWINGGQPFELPGLPIAGMKAINQIKRKQSKLLSAWVNAIFINRAQVIMAVRDSITKVGVARAKKMWEDAIPDIFPEEFRPGLEWAESEFQNKLDLWYEKEVLGRLGVSTDEDAVKAIRERLKDVDFSSLRMDMDELTHSTLIEELFWRLKQRFTQLDNCQQLSRESLEEVVVWPNDAQALYSKKQNRGPPDWEEELSPKSEEDIKKDYPKSANSLNQPSASSGSSSTASMEVSTK